MRCTICIVRTSSTPRSAKARPIAAFTRREAQAPPAMMTATATTVPSVMRVPATVNRCTASPAWAVSSRSETVTEGSWRDVAVGDYFGRVTICL